MNSRNGLFSYKLSVFPTILKNDSDIGIEILLLEKKTFDKLAWFSMGLNKNDTETRLIDVNLPKVILKIITLRRKWNHI